MIKLTKVQEKLLFELFDCGSMSISDTYAPAKKLVDIGYATFKYGRYGTCYIHISQLGIERLQK